MKIRTSKTMTGLGALFLGVVVVPAYGAGDLTGMSFKDFDANKDGYLSQEEFKAKGKDDLAFKAADLNGDERLEPSEFDKYKSRKAGDQPKSEPGAIQPKPAQPGY